MKAKRRAIAPAVFCSLILAVVDIGRPPSLAAQDIVVESANPPAAEQGTVNLDVEIKGSGFERGAVAKFLVSGTTDPGGITVNSTTFKGRARLIANITVADGATISNFDIEVQSNGRIGKGIELFSVVQKGGGTVTLPGEIPITASFRCPSVECTMNALNDRIRADFGPYSNGEADVRAVFVETGNPVLDLRESLRTLVLDFGAPLEGSASPFSGPVQTDAFAALGGATDQMGELIENRLLGMAVGQEALSNFGVNFTADGASWFLRFQPGTYSGTTKIHVLRLNADTWEIEASLDDIAVLIRISRRGRPRTDIQGFYSMPFQMRVICKTPGTCPVP